MKFLIFLSLCLSLSFALDENSQIQQSYPLQSQSEAAKLLCKMQEDLTTYLRQTPHSRYRFFKDKSASLESQALITWVHGNVNLSTLGATRGHFMQPALQNEQQTHLGDYRYDLFTLLTDLLVQMQEESDFSGSKEKAILNTLVDGYFERLNNDKLQCPCIDEALSEVKPSEVLMGYTKISEGERVFNTQMHSLSTINATDDRTIRQSMNAYLQAHKLLGVKDIVSNARGDYLILSEGKSKALNDDMVFKLSLNTLPVSYQLNAKLKAKYFHKSLMEKAKVISSFNQNSYAGLITLQDKKFYVSRILPDLKLRPQSDKTRAYKNYAAALGYLLASFHANSEFQTCQNFCEKATREVKIRVLKTELIQMVYAYNETLETKWENFGSHNLLSCK